MLTGRAAVRRRRHLGRARVGAARPSRTGRALPAGTPPPVRRLLRRCLEKDPRTRLSSIGDARLELDEREADVAPRTTTVTSRQGIPAWVALIAGAALTAVAGRRFLVDASSAGRGAGATDGPGAARPAPLPRLQHGRDFSGRAVDRVHRRQPDDARHAVVGQIARLDDANAFRRCRRRAAAVLVARWQACRLLLGDEAEVDRRDRWTQRGDLRRAGRARRHVVALEHDRLRRLGNRRAAAGPGHGRDADAGHDPRHGPQAVQPSVSVDAARRTALHLCGDAGRDGQFEIFAVRWMAARQS